MLEAANNLDFRKGGEAARSRCWRCSGEKPMASGEQSRQTRRGTQKHEQAG